MILYHWPGANLNFYYELNTLIWPRLLPTFFDDDSAIRSLGIDSVLDAGHPSQLLKLVAGSRFGGFERKPLLDRNWVIHWVRGPRTTAALGLSDKQALGDPAMLLPWPSHWLGLIARSVAERSALCRTLRVWRAVHGHKQPPWLAPH